MNEFVHDYYFWKSKEVAIIGGTGSLGRKLYDLLLAFNDHMNLKGVRIISRDEYKQWKMKNDFEEFSDKLNTSYIIGDVRDLERMKLALRGVDVLINCSAMKQIGSCEQNPFEAVQTNIIGSMNVIKSALECGVERVIHISTDKAVYPVNLYGDTKAVAEKLFTDSQIYCGGNYDTRFSVVRYGNVYGSRGSIVEMIRDAKKGKGGMLGITHEDMTRFFISLNTVANFILHIIPNIDGGCIYVPKMKAIKIVELFNLLAPGVKVFPIGMRKGEKVHECLVTSEEYSQSISFGDYYQICCEDSGQVDGVDRSIYSNSEFVEVITKDDIERWEGDEVLV